MFLKDKAKSFGLLLVLDFCLLYAPPKQDKTVQQAKGKAGTLAKKAKSAKSAKGQDEEDRLLEEALAKAQGARAVESQARDDAAQFQELFKAIDLNNSMQVKKLIDQNSRLVLMRNELGGTALMSASEQGNIEIVRMLLEKGANPDLQNDDGWSALMFASFERNIDIMRMLLNRKANIGLRNKDGFTALTISAHHGNADMVRMLLDKGADPNVPQIKGMTALMFAAYFGKADMVRLLLEAGANPALQDDAGKTALMMAENRSKKIETASFSDIVKMLKEAMLEDVVLKQDEATVSAPGTVKMLKETLLKRHETIMKMLKETLLKQYETIIKMLKEAMLKQDMEHTLKDKEHTLEEENLAAADLFNAEEEAFRNLDPIERLRKELPKINNWDDVWIVEEDEQRFLHR